MVRAPLLQPTKMVDEVVGWVAKTNQEEAGQLECGRSHKRRLKHEEEEAGELEADGVICDVAGRCTRRGPACGWAGTAGERLLAATCESEDTAARYTPPSGGEGGW